MTASFFSMEESNVGKEDEIMNFYNDKNRRRIAAIIVAVLVIAMVLPLLLYAV